MNHQHLNPPPAPSRIDSIHQCCIQAIVWICVSIDDGWVCMLDTVVFMSRWLPLAMTLNSATLDLTPLNAHCFLQMLTFAFPTGLKEFIRLSCGLWVSWASPIGLPVQKVLCGLISPSMVTSLWLFTRLVSVVMLFGSSGACKIPCSFSSMHACWAQCSWQLCRNTVALLAMHRTTHYPWSCRFFWNATSVLLCRCHNPLRFELQLRRLGRTTHLLPWCFHSFRTEEAWDDSTLKQFQSHICRFIFNHLGLICLRDLCLFAGSFCPLCSLWLSHTHHVFRHVDCHWQFTCAQSGRHQQLHCLMSIACIQLDDPFLLESFFIWLIQMISNLSVWIELWPSIVF